MRLGSKGQWTQDLVPYSMPVYAELLSSIANKSETELSTAVTSSVPSLCTRDCRVARFKIGMRIRKQTMGIQVSSNLWRVHTEKRVYTYTLLNKSGFRSTSLVDRPVQTGTQNLNLRFNSVHACLAISELLILIS